MARLASPGQPLGALFGGSRSLQTVPLHGIFYHYLQVFLILAADHCYFVGPG